MRANVPNEIGLMSKDCIAHVTFEGPIAGVRAHVVLEMVKSHKRHIAHVACIRPLTCVRANMILKIACFGRRVLTMWTGVNDHETRFTNTTTDDDDILNDSMLILQSHARPL